MDKTIHQIGDPRAHCIGVVDPAGIFKFLACVIEKTVECDGVEEGMGHRRPGGRGERARGTVHCGLLPATRGCEICRRELRDQPGEIRSNHPGR